MPLTKLRSAREDALNPVEADMMMMACRSLLDNLVVRDDIPVPRPTPNDVIIRVGAAGVNNTDINTRTAWYSKLDRSSEDASWTGTPLQFPRIQGYKIISQDYP